MPYFWLIPSFFIWKKGGHEFAFLIYAYTFCNLVQSICYHYLPHPYIGFNNVWPHIAGAFIIWNMLFRINNFKRNGVILFVFYIVIAWGLHAYAAYMVNHLPERPPLEYIYKYFNHDISGMLFSEIIILVCLFMKADGWLYVTAGKKITSFMISLVFFSLIAIAYRVVTLLGFYDEWVLFYLVESIGYFIYFSYATPDREFDLHKKLYNKIIGRD